MLLHDSYVLSMNKGRWLSYNDNTTDNNSDRYRTSASNSNSTSSSNSNSTSSSNSNSIDHQDALAWVRVNAFSPLNTGCKIFPV